MDLLQLYQIHQRNHPEHSKDGTVVLAPEEEQLLIKELCHAVGMELTRVHGRDIPTEQQIGLLELATHLMKTSFMVMQLGKINPLAIERAIKAG